MSQFPAGGVDPNKPLPPHGEPPQRSGMSPLLTCFIVCLVIFLVIAVVCGGAVWWVTANAKRLATDAVKTGIQSAINDSELSADDKAEVNKQIDRVADAFKAGDITMEDMGSIIEDMTQSPLFVLTIIEGVGGAYIDQSELTDEEKTDAKRTLQRVARGVVEEKISQPELENATDLLYEYDDEGNRVMKEASAVSAEELREVLANCKQLADDAEIPDEEYSFDIGDEFKKVVDEALNEAGGL